MNTIIVWVAIFAVALCFGLFIGAKSRSTVRKLVTSMEFVTWIGVLVSVVLLLSTVLAGQDTSEKAAASANALVQQVALESAPVLTQSCGQNEQSGWTLIRQYSPWGFRWMTGDMSPAWFVPKLVQGSYVTCTIHNYSRLPAINLHFEFAYSACPGVLTKTGEFIVPVIAAGGESKILVANESESSGMSFMPIASTQFVMPPRDGSQAYYYKGYDLVEYQLNAIPTSASRAGVKPQSSPRPYNFCKGLQMKAWATVAAKNRVRVLSFHVGQLVTSAAPPTFVFGYLSRTGTCRTAGPALTGVQMQEPIYALGRTFRITKLYEENQIAELLGPNGGVVCAATLNLAHVPATTVTPTPP